MKALLFIDTNIFLDFYRVREAGLSLLKQIDENRDRIITGGQVEMEYMKNRQREVLRALEGFKNPDWKTLTVPAFLTTSKAHRAIVKRRRQIEDYSARMKARIEGVFKDPARFDPVFRSAASLFTSTSPYNLSRQHEARATMRRLAWKRFVLGYPPRKPQDTSTGDAINWEWIIRCATDAKTDVVIVSRDSDYGVGLGKDPYLNDWLAQEFHDRVGKRRKITLTHRLAEGFKRASIPVTKPQEADEKEFLEEIRPRAVPLLSIPSFKELETAWGAETFNQAVGRYLAKYEPIEAPQDPSQSR